MYLYTHFRLICFKYKECVYYVRFRRGFNRIQHGITYAQTLGPSLINWDVICFDRLVGSMQQDRLKSTPRVTVVGGWHLRTGLTTAARN